MRTGLEVTDLTSLDVKLRAIAISRERLEALPDVPTVAEAGFKDYAIESWWGMFAPSKAPQEILTSLAHWSIAALRMPEVRQKLILLLAHAFQAATNHHLKHPPLQ